ncbi:hypothetical protein B0H15DRAFT_766017 [Mycena belliarum]|uniref:BTB domain-containing protein n=1 Tax=Mycena belliarum TaxID=1033014 RepID=A0AAD6UJ02_9AGAR|nr:hypothetical protein B0H15DRAFT_766017 [Mycena belliae]
MVLSSSESVSILPEIFPVLTRAMICFQVKSVLYKVHFSQLIKLSAVMGEIFGIPDGKEVNDPTREGSEKFPLYLEGVENQEWEDFLAWVYRAEWVPANTDEDKERLYLSLLRLSARWEIPNLTDEEMSQIGLKVYSLLVQGKERMEAEMRWVAQVPPEMVKDHSWQCSDNKACTSAFKDFWWNKIGRKLLHPSVPSDYNQIPELIKNASNWNGLHPECKLEMERKTQETIYPSEGIIAGVAAAIVAHYEKL